MGSELIVLSSDDEDDAVAPSRPAKLLKRSKFVDADNDVTVIEELGSRAIEKGSTATFPITESKPLSDDDCCILSYDPEDNVQVPEFQANDADDLVVVGERGPVACRDFPHARHLCVKFPFATTSHEKYCEQCHCYVCDAIAPCLLWGQGKQSSDHCHAFDKDEKWKKLRNHVRSGASPAPLRRGQLIQPQPRTYTQPPLRVTLTTGLKSATSHSNAGANVSSVHPCWSSLSGNWPPYLPSKMSMMLANGSHGSRASVGGINMARAGSSYIDTNVVSPANNRRRSFSEHNSSINNAPPKTASCALQPMSYQAPLHSTPVHSSIRIPHMHSPRPGAHNSSYIDTPVQQYQEQGIVPLTVAACNYAEGMNGTSQRIPIRIGKDLVTLQNYLMEGITGQSQDQYTAHGVSAAENGCTQASACTTGNSTLNGPPEMSPNRDPESLYNPFEPTGMTSGKGVGLGSTPSQMPITQASVQISKSMESITEAVAAEKPLCLGGGTDAASSLDQMLADFDDDFWTLLETTLPGI